MNLQYADDTLLFSPFDIAHVTIMKFILIFLRSGPVFTIISTKALSFSWDSTTLVLILFREILGFQREAREMPSPPH